MIKEEKDNEIIAAFSSSSNYKEILLPLGVSMITPDLYLDFCSELYVKSGQTGICIFPCSLEEEEREGNKSSKAMSKSGFHSTL